MAPSQLHIRENPADHPSWDGSWKHDLSIEGFVLESWSQGFMVGALIIMAGLTVANMKSDQLLHKLILVELILAAFHGTFCFMEFYGYGWYVSSTAVLLYSSWFLHNIIAWMKTKPFLTRWPSYIYIGTFLLTLPYWITETYGNYAFNNNISQQFLRTRPFEALCRDPWWIFTAVNLLYNVKRRYSFGLLGLIRTSPRFGIMLTSMLLSIIFLIADVLSATVKFGAVVGINPYWKLSLVFKCFCDTIILDDFRSALEKIRQAYFDRIDRGYGGGTLQSGNNTTWANGATSTQPPRAKAFSAVSTTAVPRVYPPRISHDDGRPPAAKRKGGAGGSRSVGGVLGGLFGRDDGDKEDEENRRIMVSTDISLNEHRPARSEKGSSHSSDSPQMSKKANEGW